ncbi:uncharacterized protein LOC108596789 [Drosophila busckii]|uniref:uncharacterized protein LOC108596789 n=1 Tax=Drosophila busckii TaxID=30019 RepID=UPI00083F05D8|nr:uncharacterized protein LOC108596789 [Drosophila busckii]
MLKYQYQSSVGDGHATTSMSAAAMNISNALDSQTSSSMAWPAKKRSIASNASSTHTTDSGLGNNTPTKTKIITTTAATTKVIATTAAATAAAVNGSHYSTDKSGSSGYYSSHVCSTYSLDEHIYCEPVIDILENSEQAAKSSSNSKLAACGKPTKVLAISQRLDMQNAVTQADSAAKQAAAVEQVQLHLQLQQVVPHYSDKLRILETSIENLDRHLKTFPCLTQQQQHQELPPQERKALMALDISEKLRSYNQLPTIVEQLQVEHSDDSLLDIDLDAFLLRPKGQQSNAHAGIDNACFLSDEQLEENNYKCAKYINSCPEVAYRLEPAHSSSSSYAKRYEDQLHFQSTRELLEDVRDKIRLLTPTPTTDIPPELDGMIQTLKDELESYLKRMNQHSELELRQLCSGLGRQQHVLRLQNAFERRRSYAGGDYESVREIAGLPGLRQQVLSIRCASDPNFKMKRKSITEIFPTAECYVETMTISRSATPTTPSTTPTPTPTPSSYELKTTTTTISQLQRNLSFQKPTLSTHHSQSDLGGGIASDKVDNVAEWHRKKPSIWEMYYGTNRLHQSLLGKQRHGEFVIGSTHPTLSYPSSRPESDFTLDLPRAEQLRLKMEKEKKFRQRCRFITTFLSLVFFLLTVMVVSLVLTRGKRMFGSMI